MEIERYNRVFVRFKQDNILLDLGYNLSFTEISEIYNSNVNMAGILPLWWKSC